MHENSYVPWKVLHLIDFDFKVQQDIFDMDLSKFVISTVNAPINGPQLHHILRTKYHLEMEMEAEQYVLALTSVMDSQEGFDRLVRALLEIDKSLRRKELQIHKYVFKDLQTHCKKPAKICNLAGSGGDLGNCSFEGKQGQSICGVTYLYPPGIPLPGTRRNHFRRNFYSGRAFKNPGHVSARHERLQGEYFSALCFGINIVLHIYVYIVYNIS